MNEYSKKKADAHILFNQVRFELFLVLIKKAASAECIYKDLTMKLISLLGSRIRKNG